MITSLADIQVTKVLPRKKTKKTYIHFGYIKKDPNVQVAVKSLELGPGTDQDDIDKMRYEFLVYGQLKQLANQNKLPPLFVTPIVSLETKNPAGIPLRHIVTEYNPNAKSLEQLLKDKTRISPLDAKKAIFQIIYALAWLGD